MFGGSGVIHQASTNCGIRRSSIGEHGEGLENMENLETWKTSTRWVKTLYLWLKTLVNQMAQNTLFLRNLSRHLKIITNTLLVNMILGQLKIGEHQAKCRALAPTISATYVCRQICHGKCVDCVSNESSVSREQFIRILTGSAIPSLIRSFKSKYHWGKFGNWKLQIDKHSLKSDSK